MQAKAKATAFTKNNHIRQSHGADFIKALDGNKQPIRGLWLRNGRFYAQLRVEDPKTLTRKSRRVVLKTKEDMPVGTVPEARAALERLRTQRADNNLPTLGRTPKFADYIDTYLELSDTQAKKPRTRAKYTATLKAWQKYFAGMRLADLRLDQIRLQHIHGFLEQRRKAGISPQTQNGDVVALSVALKQAKKAGLIERLPTKDFDQLKTTRQRRPFLPTADLDRFCETAFATKKNKAGKTVPVTKNAQELVDYVRLLAYSGARRSEALRLRWPDVDFQRRQLTIGADGDTKNRKSRVVEFNSKLRAHLLDMQRRRAPDTEWLFPSPQRGDRDIPLRTMSESFEAVRLQAGLPHFQLHDCRHYFISFCVMSRIDYMTIARWVGHQDGGILIGKVYGHLAEGHSRRMAEQVNFEPVALADPQLNLRVL